MEAETSSKASATPRHGSSSSAMTAAWLSSMQGKGGLNAIPVDAASKASRSAVPHDRGGAGADSSSRAGPMSRPYVRDSDPVLRPAAGLVSQHMPARRRGQRIYANVPTMQSQVDQVVFNRDMDMSGDDQFDEEFTTMFKGSAGQGSWEKPCQQARMINDIIGPDTSTSSSKSPRRSRQLGCRQYPKPPNQQSNLDQVVFGRDIGGSGDDQFDEEFICMFRNMAGKPSWVMPPDGKKMSMSRPGQTLPEEDLRRSLQVAMKSSQRLMSPGKGNSSKSPPRGLAEKMKAVLSMTYGGRSSRMASTPRTKPLVPPSR